MNDVPHPSIDHRPWQDLLGERFTELEATLCGLAFRMLGEAHEARAIVDDLRLKLGLDPSSLAAALPPSVEEALRCARPGSTADIDRLLKVIIHRRALDQLRRRRGEALPQAPEGAEFRRTSSAPAPEFLPHLRDEQRLLQACFDAVAGGDEQDRAREMLILHYRDGRTWEEIGNARGCTASSAAGLVHRLKLRLRERYLDQGGDLELAHEIHLPHLLFVEL